VTDLQLAEFFIGHSVRRLQNMGYRSRACALTERRGLCSTILITAALAGLMVPRAAHAFQMGRVSGQIGGLQGLGQTDPMHFSDSDGTPDQPRTLKLLGGTLQLSGGATRPPGNGGVNIPGAIPSSDLIPFSSSYIRPVR
jgi:hypothetical protein